MFADDMMARRIESAEAGMTAALAAATPDAGMVQVIGGGVAALARPGSPINKVIGLGFAELDEAELTDLEAAWRARGEPVRVELATVAAPAVLEVLARRGYALAGFENVLGLDLRGREPRPMPPDLAVERISDATAAAWATVAVDGWSVPDGTGATIDDLGRAAIEEVMGDFARTAGLDRYLARCAGAPAGAASVRVDRVVALLCGATTLPAYRRRGVQGALFEARLAAARAAGAELAVVTTAPGSQSQANAQRRGFALLYARAVLIRAWS